MKAFIDSGGQPQAARYFRMFPREPLAGSGMAQVTSIEEVRPWNLVNLLTAIAGRAGGNDIMIVSHGASGGLTIPLGGSIGGLGQDTINALGRVERGEMNDANIGSVFSGMRPAAVRNLVALAQRVRSLRLSSVVIRACNVGGSPQILGLLRGFFGATAICAPDLYDFFGSIDPGTPTTNQTDWTRWQRAHPNAVMYGASGNRFALEIRNDRTTFAMADTWGAVQAWVGQHLPAGTYSGQGPFYVHAMKNSETFFPNQSGYREHLRRQS